MFIDTCMCGRGKNKREERNKNEIRTDIEEKRSSKTVDFFRRDKRVMGEEGEIKLNKTTSIGNNDKNQKE